jgi:dolichol kinase
MTQMVAIGLVLAIIGVSLGGANTLRDRGVPQPVTRWVASALGSLGYLIAVVWLDAWVAVGLSAFGIVLIAALRARRASLLRGLRGPGRTASRAELGYPAAATVALAIGWGLLDDRWLACLAIAFMAWGDASAGLVRGWIGYAGLRSATASAAMLSVCLGAVWLLYPSPAGVAGALAATCAESFWPLTRNKLSDNWSVVASALGTTSTLGGLQWP